jgi:hypothetical protein
LKLKPLRLLQRHLNGVFDLLSSLLLWHKRCTDANEGRRIIFGNPSKCLTAALFPRPLQIVPETRLQLVLRAFRSARWIA